MSAKTELDLAARDFAYNRGVQVFASLATFSVAKLAHRLMGMAINVDKGNNRRVWKLNIEVK